MVLEKKAFVPYKLEEEKKKPDTITVKFNADERKLLEQMKLIIEQPKDSTALKQLAVFGAKVILSDSTSYLLDTCFKNRSKNSRLGIDLSM